MDTSTPSGKMMFQMIGVFSEFEREMISERVKLGLERVKSKGKKLGRPKKVDLAMTDEMNKLKDIGWSYDKISTHLGVSKNDSQSNHKTQSIISIVLLKLSEDNNNINFIIPCYLMLNLRMWLLNLAI